MSKPSTLREWLTYANPTILQARPRGNSSRGNTTTRNDKYPIPLDVQPWTDFSIDLVSSIFDGELRTFLDKKIDNLPTLPHIDPAFLNINREKTLESLVDRWHQYVILAALSETSQAIVQQKVKMVKGGEALLLFDDSGKFEPDWAGISNVRRRDSHPLPNNILPGEAKPSWTWDSHTLEKGPWDTVYPLRQLVFYCVRSCSRYGYLITDEELVIIRVSKHMNTTQENGERTGSVVQSPHKCQAEVFKSPAVEYTTIPWTASGESEGLTINLALWALHLLAANNGRLQTVPYGSLHEEGKIPLKKQTAIPWSEREKAIELRDAASTSFGQQSYRGDDGEAEFKGQRRARPLENEDEHEGDTEVDHEVDGDTEIELTDKEDPQSSDQPSYSQPSSFYVGQDTIDEPSPKRQRRDSHFPSDVVSTTPRRVTRASKYSTVIAEDNSPEENSGPRRSVRMRDKRDPDSGRRIR